MKLLIVLALVAAAVAIPDGQYYESQLADVDIDEMVGNIRLLKANVHCFLGLANCTPSASDIKKWIPEAMQTSCQKCTEKQKELIAKVIKAIQEKLPKEYQELIQKIDPEGKYTEELKKFLEKYGPK